MIDKDDFWQEYRIQKWLHPNQPVKNQVFDILRSKAYNYSWNNEVKHVPLELVRERGFDQWGVIDQRIDLKTMLEGLSERDKRILLMTMQEYKGYEIAKAIGISRSMVCRIKKRAYEQIRSRYDY